MSQVVALRKLVANAGSSYQQISDAMQFICEIARSASRLVFFFVKAARGRAVAQPASKRTSLPPPTSTSASEPTMLA